MKKFIQKINLGLRKYVEGADGGARFWAILTFFFLLLIWWRATLWYRTQQLAEKQLETAAEVSLQGNALSEAINRRFALLRGLQAFVLTEYGHDDFDEQAAAFSLNLYSNTSGIRNILIAPKGIITSVYPFVGNEDLIGIDLLHILQPDLKEDVLLAIETEEIVIGFPLDYAQEGWGLAARQAIILEDGTFWGLIGIVVDMPALLADAGLDIESPDLDYALLDNTKQVIYESKPTTGGKGISYQLKLPKEESWTLVGYPKEDWDAVIREDLLPIQISGLLIVLLITGQVYFLINRQAHLSAAVAQRTREIALINLSLEQQVADRTRELTTMLEVSQNVATMQDVQPLLSLILDRFQGIVPCTSVSIFLIESDHLLLRIYRGPLRIEQIPQKWSLEKADHFKAIIQQRKPVIIPDVWADSKFAKAWRQTTENHLGIIPDYIACWMGVPLMVKKHVIGMLVLHHNETGFFSEEKSILALAFSNQAALAIENTRLYEQAQQLAILRERQRLARELHDSVSQALYSIGLGARTVQSLIDHHNKGDIKSMLTEPITHILLTAEAGMAEMRALIFELRPETLEIDGVIIALSKQVDALRQRHGLEVEMDLCEEPEISFDKKLLIFRLVQESLHNIVKHAQARSVNILFDCQKEVIRLNIHDDGQGFDSTIPYQGLGLRSMRERVEQVNGSFEINSNPAEGTTIMVYIPLN